MHRKRCRRKANVDIPWLKIGSYCKSATTNGAFILESCLVTAIALFDKEKVVIAALFVAIGIVIGIVSTLPFIMQSPPVDAALIAHWKFDGARAATADDSSVAGNIGSLENDPTWLPENQCAVRYSCLSFDGVDDYVRGPEETMRVGDQWTTSAWIKLSSDDFFNIVATKMGSSNGHVNYEMKIGQDGHLVCRSHNTVGDNFQTASMKSLSLNTWYHIVCEFNGNKLKGWINGIQDGATTFSGDLCTHCVTGTPGPYTVGHAGAKSGCPGCVSQYFDGVIDEVRVYSRALSGSEIQRLYQNGQE